MKGRDVVNAFKSFLPLYTDKFTENFSIESITRFGDTVTVQADGHGRQAGS